MTLKELCEQHKDKIPGLRIRHASWRESSNYFLILGVTDHWAIGHMEDGEPNYKSLQSEDEWILFTEPRKTVKLWPYLCPIMGGSFILRYAPCESLRGLHHPSLPPIEIEVDE